ncbi:MAG: hypothetical protein K8R54_02105 [Bacteroidales bacterium]|nr:hypothetical protein [Bacteroidales bacterium]
METITIKLKNENVDFFIKLLKRLNFITEIQTTSLTKQHKNKELTSKIRFPEGKPSILDFAGLWSDNPKTLKQIREKGWKRN